MLHRDGRKAKNTLSSNVEKAKHRQTKTEKLKSEMLSLVSMVMHEQHLNTVKKKKKIRFEVPIHDLMSRDKLQKAF